MKRVSLVIAFILTLLVSVSLISLTLKSPEVLQAEQKQPAAATGKSEWVYQDKKGKLVYKKTPAGDKIMDYSHAGYMGGGVALPVVPVQKRVKPSGGPDDTKLIQAAIDEVAAMPLKDGFRGAVELAAGTYPCEGAITISADGVVLRGSGSGRDGSVIKMIGDRHVAIVLSSGNNSRNASAQTESAANSKDFKSAETTITDAYVPSGTTSFTVSDVTGFAKGDVIEIRKPVTDAWVKFMQMHDMVRDGKPQTWMRAGSTLTTQRTIAAISGKKITLDVPLSDNIDSKLIQPLQAAVVKVQPPRLVEQAGVEQLHIQAPPLEMSYQQAPYKAMQIRGKDCWVRDVQIEETMNSVSVNGSRITLERIAIIRTVPNLGASKPAEFAPNASQLLLDRCSSIGDNIWHAATGGGQAGPIVMLNCSFAGNGHIEGHQRWTTGMLLDNCKVPEGGIDFKNRGSMGSGHGWGTGWSVAWNCLAKSYVVQQPPGAYNWMIGCIGPNIPTPRPFNTGPLLPLGISDSPGVPVVPQSLYLAQLEERLGPQAVKNIGYGGNDPGIFSYKLPKGPTEHKQLLDKVYGRDVAAYKYANTSNVRGGELKFGGERAIDGDVNTYWSTDDGITTGKLEIDLEEPQYIGVVELREATKPGPRVQAYKVEAQVDSDWKLLAEGTTIGNQKVAHFPTVLAWKVRLIILQASDSPAISQFSLYRDKTAATAKPVSGAEIN
ncbi:discoidin domain-containing protein [Botryobacter ruber]|uniref:discoidin domain-containing protein n=1 Tax=Botryobacter ruber TaxID=2171629 RepID=UPI000E09F78E|nr:discoidin domain-containing protein [Botryobacter ruber]